MTILLFFIHTYIELYVDICEIVLIIVVVVVILSTF